MTDPIDAIKRVAAQIEQADMRALMKRNDELQAEVERLRAENDKYHALALQYLAQRNDALARAEDLQFARRWIPVQTQTPKDVDWAGVMILFIRWPTGAICYGFYDDTKLFDNFYDVLTGQHGPGCLWQKLPEHPKDGER
jgi:hypothetical protein